MIVAKSITQEKGINHIPEGYSYRSGYFVSLAERYAIDGRLLGRRIKLYDNDTCMSIVFPSIIVKDRIPYLGIPKLLETYGVDMEDWGKINNYQSLDKPETIHAWLSTVFIECFAKERDKLVKPAIVQKYAKKVVYALQIINPDMIRVTSDEVINDICEVKNSVSFNEDGRPQAETRIACVIDDGHGMMTLKDLGQAIRNANKTMTAPYEMLGNARLNMSRHDLRAAVLNCATALEVMLKKRVAEYFEANETTDELQEYVMKQADGYAKLVELCKKLRVSLTGLPNVQETVMKVRHRVIHGGYVPSYEEANLTYSHTRKALKGLGVKMFEV